MCFFCICCWFFSMSGGCHAPPVKKGKGFVCYIQIPMSLQCWMLFFFCFIASFRRNTPEFVWVSRKITTVQQPVSWRCFFISQGQNGPRHRGIQEWVTQIWDLGFGSSKPIKWEGLPKTRQKHPQQSTPSFGVILLHRKHPAYIAGYHFHLKRLARLNLCRLYQADGRRIHFHVCLREGLHRAIGFENYGTSNGKSRLVAIFKSFLDRDHVHLHFFEKSHAL